LKAQRRVDFITVNYGRTHETVALVESLSRLEGFGLSRVIIVDNETSAESKRALEGIRTRHSENVRVLYSDVNLFYWGAAAYAIRSMYGETTRMPEWLIVCNNDILVEQKGFISKLLAKDHEKHGIIAPTVISARTGLDQNPHRLRPFSTFELIAGRLFYANYYLARLIFLRKKIKGLANAVKSDAACGQPCRIYAPQGSFVIFSKNFFEKGGYLDTNFKIFNEELITAEVTRNIGLPVEYCPSLKVLHNEHSSTGDSFTRKNFMLSRDSYRYYRRRYISGKTVKS